MMKRVAIRESKERRRLVRAVDKLFVKITSEPCSRN